MWPINSCWSTCNHRERNEKLQRLYSDLSLALVQKNKTLCVEIMKQIKRCK